MKKCKQCGSYAINPHLHGRKENVDIDLCDVCYWRKRAIDDINDYLVDFLDSIRDYERESDGKICNDERESSEFVEIYLEYTNDKNQKINNC